MNKKSVFIVTALSQKEMGFGTANRSINVMPVANNF